MDTGPGGDDRLRSRALETPVVYPRGLRADGLPAALSDPRRVAAVHATGLLDTLGEDPFDDIARLAADLTGCARAFVTLVDDHRSFWKACIGLPEPAVATVAQRQNPIGESFCSYVVGLEGAPFAVENAPVDPRTKDHPSVGPMRIGAWAGHPIVGDEGQVLGSVCVIDDQPRTWTERDLRGLATLARSVSVELNLRQSLVASEQALGEVTALAASLQRTLLPPHLPDVPGLDCAASYLPAEGAAVVGDFYDLFSTKGRWWSTFMGDVCGHGVEAATLTSLARYTLRAEALQVRSPAAVLRRLNEALLRHPSGGRFVTAVYGTFRQEGEDVVGRLCTAGHPAPLIRRADGTVEAVGRQGTLLGVLPAVSIYDAPLLLHPGDTLLLYTDGLTEARPPRTARGAPPEEFGDAGLEPALAACAGMTAAEIVDHLAAAVVEHAAGRREDDIALLALRVPPTAG